MAVELDGGQVCGEGFDVDGSRSASIEGVSGDCPGLGEIEVSGSSPDFLIAGKEDTDWTVRYIGWWYGGLVVYVICVRTQSSKYTI